MKYWEKKIEELQKPERLMFVKESKPDLEKALKMATRETRLTNTTIEIKDCETNPELVEVIVKPTALTFLWSFIGNYTRIIIE